MVCEHSGLSLGSLGVTSYGGAYTISLSNRICLLCLARALMNVPAAIGARFAENKPFFAIIGDGGFQMCCMEIMTAVNYQLPMTIVMFNNSTMGLIRKNQFQQYDERYINCDFVNPDYELLSRSFGIRHYAVSCEADLQGLLAKIDYKESINLIEIMIDKNVFPGYISSC